MKTKSDSLFKRPAKWNLNFLLITCLILLGNLNFAKAQTVERKWNLGAMGGISVYAGDLGNSTTNFTSDVFNQNLNLGLSLNRYLNKSFDISLMATIGSWGYYLDGNTIFKGTMAHGNLNLKYKFNNGYFLSEDSKLAPYIFAGAGISNYTGDRITNGLDYPIVGGIGLRYRMSNTLSLFYQATYGYMGTAYNNPQTVPVVTPTGTDQFMLHMIGLGFNLGKGQDADKDGVSDMKDKCPNTPAGVKVDDAGCPLDKDVDGTPDYLDKCPDILGSQNTAGCPDKDKDGVSDKDDLCPNEAGLLALNGCPDSDGDGLIDSKDKCPNVKGILAFDGCPDTDGDGVKDELDLCPDVKGIIAFNGCPDTDNDGIQDSKDMCPNVAGPLATAGCLDTDNDGVHDGIDKCITIPGTMANLGCPEIKKETKQLFQKALQGIQFETGKAKIKPISYPILNAIAKVMSDNPSYKLLIGGHTDNVGADDMNMTLSQDRATAVSNYLIEKGVSPMRLSATGYGETKPVDTNDSVKGRTRNRRVEFNVEFLQ
jgi:outer membrane protein OmpA-like peptidoglycan-associated protein